MFYNAIVQEEKKPQTTIKNKVWLKYLKKIAVQF